MIKYKELQKYLILAGISGVMVFFSCGPSDKEDAGKKASLGQKESILSGKQLSLKYCQSCHLYPEPATLDKKTWERSVLPLMGRLFGIYENVSPRSKILEGAIDKKLVIDQNIFPPNQVISNEKWNKIVDYYLSNAPESLPPIEGELGGPSPLVTFEPIIPTIGREAFNTTLVKFDPNTMNIYVGGSKGKLGSLVVLDKSFEIIDEIKLPTAPTDIGFGEDKLAITLSGSLRLAPSNNPFGGLIYLLRNPGEKKFSSFRKFFHELNRPVQTVFEDINGNGFEDMLIAEFGYYTGGLSLYENSGAMKDLFKKKILKNIPGAVRTYVEDMDRDGHKDIVALFAQGDESLSIFFNDGHGGFKEERVLRFNPSYGSVYFELADFNKDGYLDILYCNGDNGDYPPILKNYHGVRIFENDGSNKFEQVYFYPMYGAFKTSAADFDMDGELDIVAVSYFPDFDSGKRGDFVYLKNNGNYGFSPQSLKDDLPARWITFEIGDMDGNGFQDILLGAMGMYEGSSHQGKSDNEALSLLYLKNLGK